MVPAKGERAQGLLTSSQMWPLIDKRMDRCNICCLGALTSERAQTKNRKWT